MADEFYTDFFTSHSINELELSQRVYNAFWNDDKRTIEEIKACSDAEIMRIPDVGRKALNQIREAIREWDKHNHAVALPAATPPPNRDFLLVASLLVEIRDLLKYLHPQNELLMEIAHSLKVLRINSTGI